MHHFLEVAKDNKLEEGFMCCSCSQCRDTKNYASEGTLHHHLITCSFITNFVVSTRCCEKGVVVEDREE
jgi:hypothetical protein